MKCLPVEASQFLPITAADIFLWLDHEDSTMSWGSSAVWRNGAHSRTNGIISA